MEVFNLLAKLTLDSNEYESGLNKSKLSAINLGNAFSKIGKIGAVALGAATTAVVGLTKAAIDGYGDFEQLAGGIETLYTGIDGNTRAVEEMMQNASQAWKTAGMSANEYMETAIESSAAMIKAVGGDTERAAELTNKAIIDMSDNVNKMGTTMEAVQNAYRGFSRGNFMMLDNLALGFAGTKQGMEELLETAERYARQNGEIRDFSIDSYADIVDAIHIVQTEMGITGTTAREAGTTIQGSVNAMKAAWSNLVTSLANGNADVVDTTWDLVYAIVGDGTENNLGVLGNVIPAVKTALKSISKVVREAAPIIANELPDLMKDILPALVSAAGDLVAAFIEGLPVILQAIGDAIPGIMNSIFDSIESILPSSLIPAFEKLRETINGVIDWLSNLDQSQIDTIVGMAEFVAAVVGVIAVLNTMSSAFAAVSGAIAFLTSPVGLVIAAIAGLVAIGITVAKNWDDIKAKFLKGGQELKQDWENMKQSWSNMVSAISSKVQELGSQFRQGFENVKSAVRSGMENVRSTIQSFISNAVTWGRDLMNNFINGIREKFAALRDAVSSAASTVKSFLGFSEPEKGPLSNFHTYAPDMMKLFAKGITDNKEIVSRAIDRSFNFDLPFREGDAVSENSAPIVTEEPARARELVLNITELIDGSVLARNQYRYNLDEADRHGGNLINAYA